MRKIGNINLDLADCCLVLLFSGLEEHLSLVNETSQTAILPNMIWDT